MRRELWCGILAGSLLVGAVALAGEQEPALEREQVYGWELMSEEERRQHRRQLQELQTEEERERFRQEHHEQMQERARHMGVILPEEPGPSGKGMGPGGGMRPGGGGGSGR